MVRPQSRYILVVVLVLLVLDGTCHCGILFSTEGAQGASLGLSQVRGSMRHTGEVRGS